ncbi:MAG: hypothetical protein ACRDLV_12110 [Solirubrobacteraceae bacterium]
MRPEKSNPRPLIASIVIAISVGIVAVAERDLHARQPSEIRGSKRIWRLACLNAIGAIAYLACGRRQPSPSN